MYSHFAIRDCAIKIDENFDYEIYQFTLYPQSKMVVHNIKWFKT